MELNENYRSNLSFDSEECSLDSNNYESRKPSFLSNVSLKIKKRIQLGKLFRLKVRMFRRSINICIILLAIILISISIFKYVMDDSHLYWSDEYDHLDDSELSFLNDLKTKNNEERKLSESVLSSSIDSPFQVGCSVPDTNGPRANAALVVLARNSELDAVTKSMRSLERHFNQWFNYPWVFLNDQPFTEEFKETVIKYTSSEVEFGEIPVEEWNFSESINLNEFHEFIENQGDRTILYGNLESYHKMCRFYSGYFYKHELVKKRDWYWRVEPDVEFYCDLTYDPFIEMQKHNKKYGFTVIIQELYYTVPGLFKETLAYVKKNNVKVGQVWDLFVKNSKQAYGDNEAQYDGISNNGDILKEIEKNVNIKKFLKISKKQDKHLTDIKGEIIQSIVRKSTMKPSLYEDRLDWQDYNLCHFWSNFEIARTDLFNSPVYEDYFKHLEDSGGFYKERWGDAPVHSLAIGMLLDLKDVHYFRDIGYRHSTIGHCPGNSPKNQLKYTPSEKYFEKDLNKDSYWMKSNRPTSNGVGCRCRCPHDHKEIEDGSTCVKKWSKLTNDNYKVFEKVDLNRMEKVIEKQVDKYLGKGGDFRIPN